MEHARQVGVDDPESMMETVRIRPELLVGLPDPRSPEWIAEAHRQSKLIAESPQEAEDQAFIDSISVAFDELD